MKKIQELDYSVKNLDKLEKIINKHYSRNRLKYIKMAVISLVSQAIFAFCSTFAFRYMFYSDFLSHYLNDDFITMFPYNKPAITWVIEFIDGFYSIANLGIAFPILVLLATSIIALIITMLIVCIINLLEKTFITGITIKKISAENDVERIKKLIDRVGKIKSPDSAFERNHPIIILFVISVFTTILSMFYMGLFFINNGVDYSLIILVYILILTLASFIPFIAFYYIIMMYTEREKTYKNRDFEKILDKWWVANDPEEKEKREKQAQEDLRKWRESRNNSSYTSGYSVTYTQPQPTSSLPDHGPYGTATNCGMPGKDGLPVYIDVSDM